MWVVEGSPIPGSVRELPDSRAERRRRVVRKSYLKLVAAVPLVLVLAASCTPRPPAKVPKPKPPPAEAGRAWCLCRIICRSAEPGAYPLERSMRFCIDDCTNTSCFTRCGDYALEQSQGGRYSCSVAAGGRSTCSSPCS